MESKSLIRRARSSALDQFPEIGAYPTVRWNRVANGMRENRLVREAGVMVGHLALSEGYSTREVLERTAFNFEQAVQPPFDSHEREIFRHGIEEVIALAGIVREYGPYPKGVTV